LRSAQAQPAKDWGGTVTTVAFWFSNAALSSARGDEVRQKSTQPVDLLWPMGYCVNVLRK
jgi:hypothetical protein